MNEELEQKPTQDTEPTYSVADPLRPNNLPGAPEQLTSREMVKNQKSADSRARFYEDQDYLAREEMNTVPSGDPARLKAEDKSIYATHAMMYAQEDQRSVTRKNATAAPEQFDEAKHDMEADGIEYHHQESAPPTRSFKSILGKLSRRSGNK